jgi:general stress protein YciG
MPNRLDNDDRSDEADDRDRQRDASGNSDDEVQGNGSRRSNRGFASMDRGKQREIASKGGKAAHAKGTAHEFDSDEARNAGRKGGQVSRGGRGRLVVPSDAPPVGTAAEGTPNNRAE